MCYQSIGRHGLVYRALRPIAKGEELCFSYPPEISNLTQLLPPTALPPTALPPYLLPPYVLAPYFHHLTCLPPATALLTRYLLAHELLMPHTLRRTLLQACQCP